MALPSRPKLRVGLPAGPGPRSQPSSATAGRSRDPDVSRHRSTASENPPSRSYMPSIPSRPPSRARGDSTADERSPEAHSRPTTPSRPRPRALSTRTRRTPLPPPPVPPLPSRDQLATRVRRSRSRDVEDAYAPRKRSDASVASWSSSSSGSSDSSFARGGRSYASSVTSVDEAEAKGAGSPVEDESATSPTMKTIGGVGSSLWTRVAAAAGALSVNVSKAWAENVSSSAGEVTPMGQESRLTRALKSYHIEKARDLSDLPEWLFGSASAASPSRRARTGPRWSRHTLVCVGPAARERPAPRSASQGPPLARRTDARSASRDKIDRLRELREAKRDAKVRFHGVASPTSPDERPAPPLPMPGDVLGTLPRRGPTSIASVPARMPAAPNRGGPGVARVGLPGNVRVRA
ncbi:hypothetical protein B0H21DRAFT_705633 [Amylocystis lapponica]|nr:hypothetical protein B0H21DRAFT_705633 [Amylocystis lapponica]